ncbi:MAG: hypothetical protein RMX66_10975, partial [Planktomarina sp.]|nr:hypothetical protein [Planktomarina sp.]
GEYIGEIEVCPILDDFNTPNERIIGTGIFPTPDDGVNQETGDVELIEPIDFEGNIAIFSYRTSTWENPKSTVAKAWTLAQQANASAVMFVPLAATEYQSENYESCSEAQNGFLYEEFGLSQSGVLTIPLLMIDPSDFSLIQQTPERVLELGPAGFQPEGLVPNIDQGEESEGLATIRISSWEPQYNGCPDNSAGAVVVATSTDSNLDGVYQENEKMVDIDCRPSSPYANEIESISSSFHYISVPIEECSSTQKFRVDTTMIFTSGESKVSEGTDYACTGLDEESFEIQLKRLVCTNGEAPSEESMLRLSVASCLAPSYEAALQHVIPQLKIESLTSNQMPYCVNGGLLITVWADGDANGAWDQSETQSIQRLCHGTDGSDGQDGDTGLDGLNAYELLVITQSADSSTCPASSGGTEVLLGRDLNDNGQLNDEELEHSYSVCNGVDGEDGSDGADGQSSVLNITSFSSPLCDGIYVRVANGHDLDNDSNLSVEETLGSRYICLPSQQTSTNATFVKESIDPNNDCLNGGVRSYIWIDENSNNIVDVSENHSEVFMETIDCAPAEDVIDCEDSDGDCISDVDDDDGESSREDEMDSDGDGVPDLYDICPGGDDNIDTDDDGIPEYCDDDF